MHDDMMKALKVPVIRQGTFNSYRFGSSASTLVIGCVVWLNLERQAVVPPPSVHSSDEG